MQSVAEPQSSRIAGAIHWLVHPVQVVPVVVALVAANLLMGLVVEFAVIFENRMLLGPTRAAKDRADVMVMALVIGQAIPIGIWLGRGKLFPAFALAVSVAAILAHIMLLGEGTSSNIDEQHGITPDPAAWWNVTIGVAAIALAGAIHLMFRRAKSQWALVWEIAALIPVGLGFMWFCWRSLGWVTYANSPRLPPLGLGFDWVPWAGVAFSFWVLLVCRRRISRRYRESDDSRDGGYHNERDEC